MVTALVVSLNPLARIFLNVTMNLTNLKLTKFIRFFVNINSTNLLFR